MLKLPCAFIFINLSYKNYRNLYAISFIAYLYKMHIAIVNLIIINLFITLEKFEIKYINSNKENVRKIVKLRYGCLILKSFEIKLFISIIYL